MNESADVQVARLQEQVKTLFNESNGVAQDLKEIKEALVQLNKGLLNMNARVEGVEKSLAKASPTIDEFIEIKHKVVGAGVAGKYVWAAGSCLLTLLATSREAIFAWLSR
jgi:predicted  nucleic acid-binding Zn-ribbon protein